jgi:cobalamin synthase
MLSACAALIPVAACVTAQAFFALTAALSLMLFYLRSLGVRRGGLNGDFLGASVVLAELISLAAMLI